MKKLITVAVAVAALFAVTGCAKKEGASIKSAEDLVNKKIGVQAGTTGEIYAADVEGADVRSFKTGIDASLALANGSIDAIILDELPAKEIVKRNPKLVILEEEFSVEDYAIAVKKGNKELLDSINSTIARIKEDGTYALLESAFMNVEGEVKIPEIESVDTKEIVRMGTNAAFPPFEYVEGDKVVGFDATMSEIIAKDYGKKLVIVDMNFDGLIAAVSSGAIDFIAAGMTATDERRENVDFSEPYYQSKQVIIARK